MLDVHFAAGGRVSIGLTAVVIFTQYTWSSDFIKAPDEMIQVILKIINNRALFFIK